MNKIVENQTASPVEINDIGITIPASGTYDLTDRQSSIQNGSPDLELELVIDAIRLIKSTDPTTYYTAEEAIRIFNGFENSVLAGGADDEALIVNPLSGEPEWIRPLAFGSVLDFAEVLVYGGSGNMKDRFLNDIATGAPSHKSAPVALGDGRIVHMSVSTESNAGDTFILQVIKNAVGQGNGSHADGTQVGADIETTVVSLNDIFTNLTNYTFSAADRISVYVKKGNNGSGMASNPVVRLYVRYD